MTWLKRNWSWMFATVFGAIMVVDLALVLTGNRSISVTTWIEERAHPTLIAGVLILGVTLAYLAVDIDKWSAFVILISTGHLITSEGAGVVMTGARWGVSTPTEIVTVVVLGVIAVFLFWRIWRSTSEID